jgi:hypothetical protein
MQEERMNTLIEGLKLSDGAMIMGKKLADMTRDELIATVAHGCRAALDARKERETAITFLSSLRRRKE